MLKALLRKVGNVLPLQKPTETHDHHPEVFAIETARDYISSLPKTRIRDSKATIRTLFKDYAALDTREAKMGHEGLRLLTQAHVQIALIEQFNGLAHVDGLLHSLKDELSGRTKTIARYASTLASHDDHDAKQVAQTLHDLPEIAKIAVTNKAAIPETIRQYG